MNYIIHIQVIGYLLFVLALIHFAFPKYFNWKEDLSKISLINRQMMKTHTFFLVLILLGMACLSAFYTSELLNTILGKALLLFLAVFWTLRLIAQLCTYSSKLWKGKTFETIVHIIFTLFWTYCSSIFWLAYLLKTH